MTILSKCPGTEHLSIYHNRYFYFYKKIPMKEFASDKLKKAYRRGLLTDEEYVNEYGKLYRKYKII